jgi:hypothetical protein
MLISCTAGSNCQNCPMEEECTYGCTDKSVLCQDSFEIDFNRLYFTVGPIWELPQIKTEKCFNKKHVPVLGDVIPKAKQQYPNHRRNCAR